MKPCLPWMPWQKSCWFWWNWDFTSRPLTCLQASLKWSNIRITSKSVSAPGENQPRVFTKGQKKVTSLFLSLQDKIIKTQQNADSLSSYWTCQVITETRIWTTGVVLELSPVSYYFWHWHLSFRLCLVQVELLNQCLQPLRSSLELLGTGCDVHQASPDVPSASPPPCFSLNKTGFDSVFEPTCEYHMLRSHVCSFTPN